ncbi:hypothetical protein FH610_014300 [Microbispora catharanthi]|uniref:histidine kinase n=2 Tax=Microbispora catharanthi TaxID=1712871 RepID=A0A5N6BX45_9ACTN|nr:ATP-binding protein [Microbispora catharanthi]KAB8185052.1 hypothetical protein FH610_014300 [Microbispora catharanthi]
MAFVGAAVQGAPPARVRVHLRAEDGTFLIRVADSGPGLDPAVVRDVFRRGWSTKGDGRGLGLAMAGQAARRLGGGIEVGTGGQGPGGQGTGGQGAVFTVRLPLPPPTEGSGPAPAGAPGGGSAREEVRP